MSAVTVLEAEAAVIFAISERRANLILEGCSENVVLIIARRGGRLIILENSGGPFELNCSGTTERAPYRHAELVSPNVRETSGKQLVTHPPACLAKRTIATEHKRQPCRCDNRFERGGRFAGAALPAAIADHEHRGRRTLFSSSTTFFAISSSTGCRSAFPRRTRQACARKRLSCCATPDALTTQSRLRCERKHGRSRAISCCTRRSGARQGQRTTFIDCWLLRGAHSGTASAAAASEAGGMAVAARVYGRFRSCSSSLGSTRSSGWKPCSS